MRTAAVLAGMVVSGAIFAMALGTAVSPRGIPGPSLLQAQSPALAVGAIAVCFALAAGVAALVGRHTNTVIGLFVLGAGLYVPAMRYGTIEDLAFAGGSLGPLAIETAIFGILVGAATLAVFRLSGELPDMAPHEGDPHGPAQRWGVPGLPASLLTLPVVWAVARSALQGQTLAAATCAGLVVGMLGRWLAPRCQPRLLYVAPCLFGALGHLAAAMMVNGPLADAWVAGNLPLLAYPRPVDYAAGTLIGVSLGLGWARSFAGDHHREEERRHEQGAAPGGAAASTRT